MKEINVLRHIKNLIAGNNISKQDMLDLYREVLGEQVKARVEKLFIVNNLEETVTKLVNRLTVNYLEDQIRKSSPSSTGMMFGEGINIKRLITDEISKQVLEEVRKNFSIKVLDKDLEIGGKL